MRLLLALMLLFAPNLVLAGDSLTCNDVNGQSLVNNKWHPDGFKDTEIKVSGLESGKYNIFFKGPVNHFDAVSDKAVISKLPGETLSIMAVYPLGAVEIYSIDLQKKTLTIGTYRSAVEKFPYPRNSAFFSKSCK